MSKLSQSTKCMQEQKRQEEKNKIKLNSSRVYQLLTIRAIFEQSVNHCMVLFLLFLLMQDTLDRVKDRVFQCKMCVCMMRYILFSSLVLFAIVLLLVFFAAFDSWFFSLQFSFVHFFFLFGFRYTMTWFAICRSICFLPLAKRKINNNYCAVCEIHTKHTPSNYSVIIDRTHYIIRAKAPLIPRFHN